MTNVVDEIAEAKRRRRIALGQERPPAALPREDDKLEQVLEVALAETGKPGTNFVQVTPAARKKLKGLIDFYRKKPHPFTSCVNDNRKRFGNRAEKVCAVLKDLEMNTTKWRKGGAHASEGDDNLVMPELDNEVAGILLQMTPIGLAHLGKAIAEMDGDIAE